MAHCFTCHADWSAGQFSADCEECGGGAMQRPCMYCDGSCGKTMSRAVSDSNDSHLGHWFGPCGIKHNKN